MTYQNISTLLESMANLDAFDTSTLQQASEAIRSTLRNRTDAKEICIVWSIADIQERRPDLTNDQCREVLRKLSRNHDAEIGVSWDVIDVTADICFPESS